MIIEHEKKSELLQILTKISNKFEIIYQKNLFHPNDRPKNPWQHYKYAKTKPEAIRLLAELRLQDGHKGGVYTYMIKDLTKVKK